MAKVLYSLKTWMFGLQLELPHDLDSKLLQLNIFICRAYVRAWFQSTLAAQAPRNDLAFVKLLFKNRNVGTHWEAALKKFSHPLWCLSPMLVCMALFDDGVSLLEKKNIVAAFQRGDNAIPPTRASVTLDRTVRNLELHDFASKQCLRFFSATGISPDFLGKDPVDWKADRGYEYGFKVVSNFKVVNDAAERGVQLITRYIKGNNLTMDEDERQRLLLVVSEDRKKISLVNVVP